MAPRMEFPYPRNLPRWRFFGVVIGFVASAVGLLLWLGWQTPWASLDDPQVLSQFLVRLQQLVWVVGLVPGLLGLYLAILAGRVLRIQQYPLPGTLLIRSEPFRTGSRARWTAWMLASLATLLLGIAVLFSLGIGNLISRLQPV